MNYLALAEAMSGATFDERLRQFEQYDGGKREPMSLEDAVALAMDLSGLSFVHEWAVLRDLDGGHYVAPSVGSWGVPPKEYDGRIEVYFVNRHGAGMPINIYGQNFRRARDLGFDIQRGYQCRHLPRMIYVAAPAEMAAEDVWTRGAERSRRKLIGEMAESEVLVCRRIDDGAAVVGKPVETAGGQGFRIRARWFPPNA